MTDAGIVRIARKIDQLHLFSVEFMRIIDEEIGGLKDRIVQLIAERDEARSQRDYAIEVKQNCDKIIADLMNERDRALAEVKRLEKRIWPDGA